jgi:hypothetical protein
MEPEGSLLCSQESTAEPYPKPAGSNPHTASFFKIHSDTSHLHLCLPSGLFPSGFLTNILHVFFISSMYATCPIHFIVTILF